MLAIEVRFTRLILDRFDAMTAAGATGTTALDLDTSQSELALMAGCTRQRTNAALMSFECAGAIRREGKTTTSDREELLKIALRHDRNRACTDAVSRPTGAGDTTVP